MVKALFRLLSITSFILPRTAQAFVLRKALLPFNINNLHLKPRYLTMSSSEVDAAAIAASSDPAINPSAPTFFDKLVSKEIPAKTIYEDDLCMAFHDINPQGPVHFLVIPKQKDGLNRLSNMREDQKMIMGHLMFVAQKCAHDLGLVSGGFRTVINDGKDGAQSVYHLHVHVIGGRQMSWPPG